MVSDRFSDYARHLEADLRASMVRVELDTTSDRINKAIRNASTAKIPNVLVIGEREVEEGSVTLRLRGVQKQESMSYEAFKARLLKTIAERSVEFASET